MVEAEIKQPSNFLDIWHLTRQQTDFLTEEVREASGEVYVFVHPFYICEGISWDDEEPPEYKVHAKPEQVKAFVQIIKNAVMPVILFEQRGWPMERTQKILASAGINKSIYFIPTVPEDPQPAIIADHLRKVISTFPKETQPWELIEDRRVEELSWELTCKKLASFGIDHMKFTGRTYPEGCAGIAEDYLRKKFTVNVMLESYLQNFLHASK